jgi:hypothetical protein
VVDSLLDALLTSDLTSQSISPVIVRRYVRIGDIDAACAGLAMIMRIRREAWTPEMVEEAARSSTENIQIREAALDGRPLSEISSQLLADIALLPVPTATADDDIAFASTGEDSLERPTNPVDRTDHTPTSRRCGLARRRCVSRCRAPMTSRHRR